MKALKEVPRKRQNGKCHHVKPLCCHSTFLLCIDLLLVLFSKGLKNY